MGDGWKLCPINSWAIPLGFGVWRVAAYYGPDRAIRKRVVLGEQRAMRLMWKWNAAT